MSKIDRIRAQLRQQYPAVDKASDYEVADFARRIFYPRLDPAKWWSAIGMRNPEMGGANAFAGGVIEGIPVVGPPLKSAIDEGIAQVEHLQGRPLEEARARLRMQTGTTREAHPALTTAGGITGAVGGLAAAGAAAPGLMFGGEGAGVARTIAQGSFSTAVMSALDDMERQAIHDKPLGGVNMADITGIDPGQVGEAAARGFAGGAVAGPLGQLAGAAARPVARALYRAGRRPPGGLTRSASKMVERALVADSDVGNIVAELRRLGPEGSIIDAGPSTERLMQGIAETTGLPRTTIFKHLRDRAAAAPGRIRSSLTRSFGPEVAPKENIDAFKQVRTLEHQLLPAIYKSAGPVDVQKVVDMIDHELGPGGAVGPQATALKRIRRWFLGPGPVGPTGTPILMVKTGAEQLQRVKEAIDNMIYDGNKPLGIVPSAVARADGSVVRVRRELSQAMRDQVPGYGDVMDRSAAAARVIEEFQSGFEGNVTATGKKALHPRDYQKGWDQLPPELKDALRAGTRADIERQIFSGQNSPAIKMKSLAGAGPESWPIQKLGITYGLDAADQFAEAARREAQFGGVKHRIVDNSQTAGRVLSSEEVNPVPGRGLHGPTLAYGLGGLPGVIGYGAARGVGKIAQAASNVLHHARNLGLANLAAAPDAPGLAEALIRRAAGAERIAGTTGSVSSNLARALAGAETIARQGKDVPPWPAIIGTGGSLIDLVNRLTSRRAIGNDSGGGSSGYAP